MSIGFIGPKDQKNGMNMVYLGPNWARICGMVLGSTWKLSTKATCHLWMLKKLLGVADLIRQHAPAILAYDTFAEPRLRPNVQQVYAWSMVMHIGVMQPQQPKLAHGKPQAQRNAVLPHSFKHKRSECENQGK